MAGVSKVSKQLAASRGPTSSKVSDKMQKKTAKVKNSLKPEKITKAMSAKAKKQIKEVTGESSVSEKSVLISPDILRIPPVEDKPSALQEHSSVVQSLTDMLSFFKKSHDSDLKDKELERIDENIDYKLYQQRQQEVMDVFLQATKNKIEYEKKLKAEQDKVRKKKLPERKKEEDKGIISTIIDYGKKAATYVYKQRTAIVSGGAFIAGALSSGIARGESGFAGYSAANMGTRNNKIIPVKEKLNLEEMTVGEIMRRQSIPWGAPNEKEKLFAVGKYQVIPTTLSDAVNKLNINPKETFTKDLQEKIFTDYLIKIKRPAIAKYLNSPEDDPKLLNAALTQLSLEWASFADPNIPGGATSHYGHGNKASITVEQATQMLKRDRESTQKKLSVVHDQSAGKQLNDVSVERIELKKELSEQSTVSTAIIQQNNVTNVVKKTNVTNVIEGDNANPMLGR